MQDEKTIAGSIVRLSRQTVELASGRWLSGRKDIAEHLSVTGRTVSRLLAKYPDFPVSLLGRKMMAKPEDIDAWVRKHAAKPCAECGGMRIDA